MRILVTIPHYCVSIPVNAKHGATARGPLERSAALAHAIAALHQQWGSQQAIIQVGARRTKSANGGLCHTVDVVVVTDGRHHALHDLTIPEHLFEHLRVEIEPVHLGFACHKVLAERSSDYDYCGFMEDDLIVHDPWWFDKLEWFIGHVGADKILLPNRYEVAIGLAYQKVYLDGDLAERVTNPDYSRVGKLVVAG